MIRIHQCKLSIDQPIQSLKDVILKKLKIKEHELLSYHIFKESIDARDKHQLYFNYCVDCEVVNESKILKKSMKDISLTPVLTYQFPICGNKELKNRPIVIGFGPAGMFAALLLAQMGYQPIVFERGECVEKRLESVQNFWQNGVLNPSSNVQFGEGGAGTFSDGKLTTRVKDLRSRKVLEEFVKFGAPEEILYEAHPHIGTDLLQGIVRRIREEIIRLGGDIHFESMVDDFEIKEGKICSIHAKGVWYPCEQVILAIGHSARETFIKLYEKKVEMQAKAFAIGARVEHKQSFIDKVQFKKFAGHPRLGAAEYRFVHKASNGRGVYTFCMCPGGTVVPSASSINKVVVNGMSEHARNEENANSALLVQVSPDDFGIHPLDGIKFQERLEEKAFEMGGKNYKAPAQKIEDFLQNKVSDTRGEIHPSYNIGVTYCNLHELFPKEITETLIEGITAFDRMLPGFAQDALMTAVETRSSSPVRILRHEDTLSSLNVSGLYPCGEGAGYAGGIVSAGIDGLRCAEKIIQNYKKKA